MHTLIVCLFAVIVGILFVCVRAVLYEIQNSISPQLFGSRSIRKFQGNADVLDFLKVGNWLILIGALCAIILQITLIVDIIEFRRFFLTVTGAVSCALLAMIFVHGLRFMTLSGLDEEVLRGLRDLDQP